MNFKNNFVIIGKLVDKKQGVIVLAQETDLFTIHITKVQEKSCEILKKGDMIGVGGKIKYVEKNIELFAERITYITDKEEGN